MASGYVVNARVLSATQQLATQLQHALDSRVVIEQAKGILAGRTGRNPEDAFAELRGHARRHGVRLHDVAREVVEGTLTI
jgi:AmiR/NasT family two-component response regulator